MADHLFRFGLKESSIQKINHVFSQYPEIEKAVIYGSRAKGNYRHGSDIDITLFGHLSLKHLSRISTQLDDLYLPYTIDLSLYNDIDTLALIKHIDQVGKIFYQKKRTSPAIEPLFLWNMYKITSSFEWRTLFHAYSYVRGKVTPV